MTLANAHFYALRRPQAGFGDDTGTYFTRMRGRTAGKGVPN